MLKKLIFITLALFTLGNLTSLGRFSGFNIYLFDIGIFAANLLIGMRLWQIRRLNFNFSILVFLIYIAFSFLVTIFNIYFYNFSDQVVVLSYLIRFFNYGWFGFLIYNLIKSKTLLKSDLSQILAYNFYLLLFLNLVQFVFFRDISSLAVYGFDPHQTRLTGTFLDPNFMGIYLVLYFIYSLKNINSRFISYSSFLMILLTESRSAILCLIVALLFISIKNLKYLIYLALVLIFTLSSSFIDRVELSSAANDSSQLRVVSWRNAFQLSDFSPYFGIGFNNYRIQLVFQNLISPEDYYSNSSNASDSSLLSVYAMGGLIGLILFLIFMGSFVNKENFIYLLVIFLNSSIINSLFFPSIIVLLFTILNLNLAKD
jgi:hypothetical protein